MKKYIIVLFFALFCCIIGAIGCQNVNNNEPEKKPEPEVKSYFTIVDNVVTEVTIDGKREESLVIPEGVTAIADEAFKSCEKLQSITLPESLVTIGNSAFFECKRLTQINLPNSIQTIGESAFYNCFRLTSITLPTGINTIANDTFRECRALESISFPANITTIGSSAFKKCISITSIHIPATITQIGESAFVNCSSNTAFTVDENNAVYRSIDGNLYSKNGKILIAYALGKTADKFVIPSGVTDVGDYAFFEEEELIEVVCPSTLKTLGYASFSNCSNLNKITFGGANSSLTHIHHRAFFECISLSTIEAPLSLVYVGRYAFSYCHSISKVISYLAETDWNNVAINIDNSKFTNASVREYV